MMALGVRGKLQLTNVRRYFVYCWVDLFNLDAGHTLEHMAEG